MLLQISAQVLVLCRQLERLAEMIRILVSVETRLVGGNLEENAAGRAEIRSTTSLTSSAVGGFSPRCRRF